MAGIPLKSGADFYNLEASRMRLHNLGADPTEVGTGLIYFNTSTGMNTSGRARIYTGNGFKSLAFLEDVDGRIKTIEDMLNVDTAEGVVSTWNEIQAFLDSVQEGTDLMDMLNDKLSLSEGGTVKKPITVNSEYSFAITNNATGDWSGVRFRIGGTNKGYLGISSTGNPIYVPADMSKMHTILHEGNYSDYALPLTGGTIKGTAATPLFIVGSKSQVRLALGYGDSPLFAYLVYKGGFNWCVTNESYGGEKTIAFTDSDITGNAGGLVSEYLSDINAAGYNKVFSSGFQATNRPYENYATGLTIYNAELKYTYQLAFSTSGKLFTRYNNNSAWQDWKTIAFTDSNVASAQALQTSGGVKFAEFAESVVYIGGGTYQNYNTSILGKSVRLYSGNASLGLLLNSSGNVTIGARDLAGISRKLFVSGGSAFFVNTQSNITTTDQLDRTKTFTISAANDDKYNYGLHVWIDPSGRSNLQSSYAGLAENKSTYPIALNPLGGNVLIGTTDDNGAKLQVNGSTRIYRENDSRTYLDITNEDVNINYNAYDTDGFCSHVFKSNNEPILLLYGVNKSAIFYGNIEATGFISTKDRLEVYGSQPYIDFHHGNSTEDYTTRLIEQTKGTLKLVGDLHVTGNIIADKNVSAGGAAEEGGEGGGGTGGGVEPYVFTFTPSTTTVSVNHNISSEDVIVQVYEKDATSGKWSVILVDIEIVDSTRVDLHFGRTETTEHKVVIIG